MRATFATLLTLAALSVAAPALADVPAPKKEDDSCAGGAAGALPASLALAGLVVAVRRRSER